MYCQCTVYNLYAYDLLCFCLSFSLPSLLQLIQEELEQRVPFNRQGDMATAQDLDTRLAAAESKQSGKKRDIFLADMKRQSKRERQSGIYVLTYSN